MARDANFQRTFVIKIHGVTGEGDIPRFVHRDLWNTMQDLSRIFKTLHYSITEKSDEPESWGGSDMWPDTGSNTEYVNIKVNASPEPTATSE